MTDQEWDFPEGGSRTVVDISNCLLATESVNAKASRFQR